MSGRAILLRILSPLYGGRSAGLAAAGILSSVSSLRRQAGRFGLVGLANTAIDFAAFSTFRVAGLPWIPANVLSASIGIAFSYFANRTFVFAAHAGPWRRQLLLFLAGTAFSMYVLQTAVIYGLANVVPAPLDLAWTIAQAAGLRSETAEVLVRSNAAKLLATAVSMTWNFCFYRFLVFRVDRPADATLSTD